MVAWLPYLYTNIERVVFSVEKFIGLMVLSLYYFLSPYTDNYTTNVVILSSYYLYVIILLTNYYLYVIIFQRFYNLCVMFSLITVFMIYCLS